MKAIGMSLSLLIISMVSCNDKGTTHDEISSGGQFSVPKEIIDLGALITEDLPDKIWGKTMMKSFGFEKSNSFEIINWKFDSEGGSISGSNAYYTLFNHGGPHVDAPNHIGIGSGLDSYSIESFIGPVKVFNVSNYSNGRTVPIDVFKDKVQPGDIVLIYTKYEHIRSEDGADAPKYVALTGKAAEFLASIPVRAFGTDAFSVDAADDSDIIESGSVTARMAPVHNSFLSRSIPVYEQLFNIEKLLDKQNMLFVGVPLNIKNGDGMIVRPVVLVY